MFWDHRSKSDLWVLNQNYKHKPSKKDTSNWHEKQVYAVSTTHPLYVQLRKQYGLDLNTRKNGTEIEEEEEEDSTEE